MYSQIYAVENHCCRYYTACRSLHIVDRSHGTYITRDKLQEQRCTCVLDATTALMVITRQCGSVVGPLSLFDAGSPSTAVDVDVTVPRARLVGDASATVERGRIQAPVNSDRREADHDDEHASDTSDTERQRPSAATATSSHWNGNTTRQTTLLHQSDADAAAADNISLMTDVMVGVIAPRH